MCVDEACGGVVTFLNQIYEECGAFFNERSLLPPTKDLLSKLISALFHVTRDRQKINGQRTIAYYGLTTRTTESEKTVLPENCMANPNENEELVVTCEREYAVDGKRLKCSVVFGRTETVLMLRGATIPLNYHILLTQSSLNGLCFLLANLKLCRGILLDEKDLNRNEIEAWQLVSCITSTEIRTRSQHCHNVLSQNSTVEHCHNCAQLMNRIMNNKDCTITSTNTEMSRLAEPGARSDKEAESFHQQTESVREQPGKDHDTELARLPEPGAPIEELTTELATLSETEASGKKRPISEVNDDYVMLDGTSICTSDPEKLSPCSDLDSLFSEAVPEKFQLFMTTEMRNSQKSLTSTRRRWDLQFISVCLGLYVRSPKAYSDLRESNLLTLPSERLLRMYKNCIQQKPGLNEDNITWMTKEADRQNISSFGRRGGLCLDEMAIQDDLQIVREGDAWKIVGAVDMGAINNSMSVVLNQKKKVELATHCCQYVFHGFTGFRWPIAYYASNPATAHQLFVNLWEIVDIMDEHGFTVDYVMLDGASTNRSFMNMLLDDNPRAQKYAARDIYNLDHKVYIIQDVKHVVKKLRNNIEASKAPNKTEKGRYLLLNGSPIVWEYFEEAFKFNRQNGFRIHRRLTREHIELTSATKMRNSLAEEVLNKDMLFLFRSYQATLDSPERLDSTICLLEKTSVLVELFTDKRPISEVNDERLKSLSTVLSFFNSWEKSVTKSGSQNASKNLFPQETRDDLNSCITGFSEMCQSVVGAGNSITPAFINSDIVENHFCQQRGTVNGMNTNPTLAHYGPSNTSICLSQTSVSSKGNSGLKALPYKATTPCPLNKRRKPDNRRMRVSCLP